MASAFISWRPPTPPMCRNSPGDPISRTQKEQNQLSESQSATPAQRSTLQHVVAGHETALGTPLGASGPSDRPLPGDRRQFRHKLDTKRGGSWVWGPPLGHLPAVSLVARAGFEPATSGL